MSIESAGYAADQIDVLVLSRVQPDRVGGLMEYDFWTAADMKENRVGKLIHFSVAL